jgi:hypothetical protein
MSRGILDKETATQLDESLPSVNDVRVATLSFRPDLISVGFPPKSKIPIAAICLQDTTSSLEETRYALLEALAHIVWYRERSRPLNENLAIFFGKFYADDTALRIFAAKEHLTNAIVNILELNDQNLKNLKKNFRNVDDLTKIGKYLKQTSPNHPLVNPICKLIASTDWVKTKKYRNDWVHNKPPIVSGLGISYERRNRLIVTQNSIGVTFGQGDKPNLSIDELLAFVKSAFSLLVETTSIIIEYYIGSMKDGAAFGSPFFDKRAAAAKHH